MKSKTDKSQNKTQFIWFDDALDFALPDRMPPEEKDLKETIDQVTAIDIAIKYIYENVADCESEKTKAKSKLSRGYKKHADKDVPNARGRHYGGRTGESPVILNTRDFFEWVLQKGWYEVEGLKPVDGWQLRLKRAVGIYHLSVTSINAEAPPIEICCLGPSPPNYEEALKAWMNEGFKRLQLEKENERLAQRVGELEEEVKRHKPGRRPKVEAG